MVKIFSVDIFMESMVLIKIPVGFFFVEIQKLF